MKTPAVQGASDDFQTPGIAIKPLLPFIPKDWLIWECASGRGNLVKEFRNYGYDVLGTDINMNEIFDFLTYEPEDYDVIITNPPFSLKQQFLERAYYLRKPFAFLLPLTTFETAKRQKLFKEFGVEVIFFDKRINFETPSGRGSSSWFATAWFTNGLNIGKELTFVELA